ncbi:MAG TPA: glycosyltransferase, partial [Gammaproteobacteria bacterium]|nr:glycosyltransferase [Gammaproteobacteria bacterium]
MTDQAAISAIIPVSERHDDLRELHAAYEAGLAEYNVEFCYVIDGDFPEAVSQLQGLQQAGKDLKVFQLARCFGEATALRVGFERTTAELLLTLPAYFQVDPADLPRLLESLEDNDMVVVRRFPRFDSGFNRVQTRVFHWWVGRFTGNVFHDLGC